MCLFCAGQLLFPRGDDGVHLGVVSGHHHDFIVVLVRMQKYHHHLHYLQPVAGL